MNIASVRYTRRVNLGNYEHNELTVEVVPDEGQTAEDVVTRTKNFVEANLPLSKGAPITTGQPAPPLAAKAAPPVSQPPAAPAPAPAAEPTPKKRGRGRPKKASTQAMELVDAACLATNFNQLLAGMNKAREKASALKPEEWRACCKRFKERYAAVNTAAEDPKVGQQIVDWFHSEWTAIEEATLRWPESYWK